MKNRSSLLAWAAVALVSGFDEDAADIEVGVEGAVEDDGDAATGPA